MPPIPTEPAAANAVNWAEDASTVAAAQRERDVIWPSVRNQTVDRLLRMNIRHAAFAWEVRRDRPVAPWAVAFLYTQPLPDGAGAPRYRAVAAATRMILEDSDLGGPAHLLFRLTELARDRYLAQSGEFDPVVMTTHQDPVEVPAPYLGVGLSCLGRPGQPWSELRRGDSGDIPGQGFAILADGSVMLIDRAARRDLSRVMVHSTGELSFPDGAALRPWTRHRTVESIPAPMEIWEQLHWLHVVTSSQPHPPILNPVS
jgi:hypothetical protein